MMSKRQFLLAGLGAAGAGALARLLGHTPAATAGDTGTAGMAGGEVFEVTHTEAEWRKLLTPAQFKVLRQHGTERPGSSPLNDEKRAGTFQCAGCQLALFSSTTKYDSGTGWPSFWEPLEGAVGTREDTSLFMTRTEVHCRRCGGHLGHVFNDGPPPTGLRYCINGVALTFVPT
jgi:peptide-methionine (R)-S-oxide reductase